MGEKRTEGTICVFLALVLVLILSLILVFLEGARRAVSASYAQMLLKTSTESVLGEYFGPLLEEYHIFALDKDSETRHRMWMNWNVNLKNTWEKMFGIFNLRVLKHTDFRN